MIHIFFHREGERVDAEFSLPVAAQCLLWVTLPGEFDNNFEFFAGVSWPI